MPDNELVQRLLAVLDAHGWEPDDLAVVMDAAKVGMEFAQDEMAGSMDRRIESAWRKATELEREACALLAEAHAGGEINPAIVIAEDIRERTTTRGQT